LRGGPFAHVEEHLHVEPQRVGQREALTHAKCRDPADHVVAGLGGLTRTGITEMRRLRAHHLQQRHDLSDMFRIAAQHEGHGAGPRRFRPAGNGSVNKAMPRRVGLGGEVATGRDVDGGTVDEDDLV